MLVYATGSHGKKLKNEEGEKMMKDGNGNIERQAMFNPSEEAIQDMSSRHDFHFGFEQCASAQRFG